MRFIQQAIAGLKRSQHFLDAALEGTLSRRDAGLDVFDDREAAFLAELQDCQFLVWKVLGTSGDAEVGDSFQGSVHEKADNGLLTTDSNHRYQPISWQIIH